MDLDELRTVRRTEREKDSLQHLRDSFYEDVAAYLSDLEARRDRAAAEADDPFASTDVRKLTDKIETAEEVSEAIYERRVGKIVKQASFAAAGMSADRDGLTDQEAELYDDIVDRIKENKSTVLDILAGEDADSGSAPSSPARETAVGDAAVTAALGDDTTTPETIGADQTATDSAGGDATDAPPDTSPAEPIPAGGVDGGESATSTVPEESTATSESDGMLADAMGGASAEESPDRQDSAEQNPAEPGPSVQGQTDSGPANATRAADSEPTTDAGLADDDRSTDGDGHTPTTDGGATQLQRTTVRITQDVGEIFGVDEREYTLEREDVVTLPTTNAEPLVERDAAEPLE